MIPRKCFDAIREFQDSDACAVLEKLRQINRLLLVNNAGFGILKQVAGLVFDVRALLGDDAATLDEDDPRRRG